MPGALGSKSHTWNELNLRPACSYSREDIPQRHFPTCAVFNSAWGDEVEQWGDEVEQWGDEVQGLN